MRDLCHPGTVRVAPVHQAQARQIAAELAKIARSGMVLPGSIIERRTRCGHPNCACHADPPRRHGPYWQWTRKVAAKTICRWLSPGQHHDYKTWISNDRRLHELLGQLETLGAAALEADPRLRQHRRSPADPTPRDHSRDVGTARLTCGQAPDHMPNAQLRPKREDVTRFDLGFCCSRSFLVVRFVPMFAPCSLVSLDAARAGLSSWPRSGRIRGRPASPTDTNHSSKPGRREPCVEQARCILCRQPGIARQPGENGVGLGKRVSAQRELLPVPPPNHFRMMLVGTDQQRDGDTRINRDSHLRPASMRPKRMSSSTGVSPAETSTPSSSTRRAVRPAGTTWTPAPYGEISTFVPGSRPSASRMNFGSTIRPAWSTTASMGKSYRSNPTELMGRRCAGSSFSTQPIPTSDRCWTPPRTGAGPLQAPGS